MATEFQDSNGDGTLWTWGFGVDEDYSEQFITDLVNTREIYLIPLLNVDGAKYDHEVFVLKIATACLGVLRNQWWMEKESERQYLDWSHTYSRFTDVDESCDGVDFNRNYQYEWGAPLGATGH